MPRPRYLMLDCLPGPVEPVGGLEVRLLNWANHLGPGHDITLGSLAGPHDTPRTYRRPGEPFTRRIFADLDDLRSSATTYDAMSVHQWHEWLVAPDRSLYMIHSSLPECFRDEYAAGADSPAWHTVVAGVRSARTIATCSNWASTSVRDLTGRDALTLYAGVHDAYFHATPPPQRNPVIAFHGRFVAYKGVHALMDCVQDGSFGPYTLEATSLGADPDALARAHALEASGKRIRVLDPFHDRAAQAAHLSSAAIAVAPSLNEGFGTVAVEAQAAGTRMIAYDCGGLAETIEPDGGALVPPGDVDALLTALHAHAGKPVPQDTRRRLHSRYSMQASASAYLAALQDIARTANSPSQAH